VSRGGSREEFLASNGLDPLMRLEFLGLVPDLLAVYDPAMGKPKHISQWCRACEV
jgi:hypothetical protein